MKSTASMFSAIVLAVLFLGNHPCGAAKKPATKRSLRSGIIIEEKASSNDESRDLEAVAIASDSSLGKFNENGIALGNGLGNVQSARPEESCTLVFTGDFAGQNNTKGLSCQTDDGILFQITGTTWTDKVWVDNGRKSGLFKSGETRLIMTGLNKINNGKDKFEIEGPANIHGKIVNPVKGNGPPSRKLATLLRTVLMVRAQPMDKSIVQTEAQLSADLFGTAPGQVSMKKQFEACSFGKLNIIPAPNRVGAAYSITNGLVTVPLPTITSTPTTNDTTFVNAITEALNTNFDVGSPRDLAHHVMYCLPNGRNEDMYIAWAYINHYLSVYKEDWCDRLSANMHELGHNLNLAHSGENDATGSFIEYADQTGMMGYSYNSDDGPNMCFNAAKSWQLGWYSDKTMVLDANNNPSFVGNLAGIVDYGTTSDKVLLRIKSTAAVNPTDYYVNFNKATGINDMTQEYPNKVTVVAQGGGGTDYSQSRMVAALDAGGSFTESWNVDTMLTITVGAIGTVAHVTAKLHGLPCVDSSDCQACGVCGADKYCVPHQSSGEPGELVVNIKTNNYPEDTSWVFTGPDGSVIAQRQRNVYYTKANTVYSDTVPLESLTCGIYTFTLYDLYHDGLCCLDGPGYYNLFWNGNLTKSGGQFGTSETTTFRVNAAEFATASVPTNVPTKAPTKAPTDAPTLECTTHAKCDDGKFCNGIETCINGQCVAGTAPCPQDDNNFCNGLEVCDEVADTCRSTGDPCLASNELCHAALSSCVQCLNNSNCGTDEVCSPAGSCVKCLDDSDCDDGKFCNGAETCSNGVCLAGNAPVCDDGLFCNGVETCSDAARSCITSGNPCDPEGKFCDAAKSSCVQCLANSDCDDGSFCNGAETCSNGQCVSGSPPSCDDGEYCNGVETCSDAAGACVAGTLVDCGVSSCGAPKVCSNVQQGCVDQNVGFGLGNDGVCNVAVGESCATCPGDCTSTFGGFTCGNGICEDGEDCNSCSLDCGSKTNGPSSGQYCCAGGPGGCSNSNCNGAGKTCTTSSSPSGTSCCGDTKCEGNETQDNCPSDCQATGPAPQQSPAPQAGPAPQPSPAPQAGPAPAPTPAPAPACGTCSALTSETQCASCSSCTWSSKRGGSCS